MPLAPMQNEVQAYFRSIYIVNQHEYLIWSEGTGTNIKDVIFCLSGHTAPVTFHRGPVFNN